MTLSTTEARPIRRRSPEIQYVFAERVRCPECGSTRLAAYKSYEQADGSKLRYSRCRDCGTRCKIVFE